MQMKISREAHSSRRRQRPSYPKNRLKQINAKLLIKMKIDFDMAHESRLLKIIWKDMNYNYNQNQIEMKMNVER